MGHQRLGKLPAHRLLPEIIRYLVTGGTPTKDLVDQVTADCVSASNFDPPVECAPAGGQNVWFKLTLPAGFPEDGNHDEASVAQCRIQAAGC